jgi:predicted AlkP superfamily phosphohydrolase/phosphomutase
MVAGRGIPRQGEFHVYPESEQRRLEKLGYQPFTVFSNDLRVDAEAADKTVRNYVDGQMRTVEAHLEEHDLVQLSILVTDTYQHEWLNGQETLELYSYIDRHLGNLEDIFDDLNVVIVSDHGMTTGPDKVIWVNRWLKERGWLVTRTSEEVGSERKSLGTRIRSVYDRLPRGVKESIEAGLDEVEIRETLSQKVPQEDNRYNIDWEQTEAVVFTGGIRVRDRDPELAEEIQSAFEEDFGHLYPDDLKPFLHRTEAWSGEYVDSKYAPDLVKNPKLKRHVRTRRKQSDQVVTPFDPDEIHHHEHDPVGVFIADGPRFGSAAGREEMRIYDVMPTLLAAYGYQIDGRIDGSVPSAAVARSDYEAVDELPAPVSKPTPNEGDKQYTDEIEDQLESLGYLQ